MCLVPRRPETVLFLCPEVTMRFLIDRNELPYDAMVSDPSQLIPIDDEEGEDTDDKKAEEIQTDKVHG